MSALRMRLYAPYLIAPFTVACVLVFLGLGQVPVIEGRYRCTGLQTSAPYTAFLIVEVRGLTYEFTWSTTEDGAITQAGLGVPEQGDIAVAIVSPTGGMGVAIYHVTSGRLDGVWTRGDGAIETERCHQGDKDA